MATQTLIERRRLRVLELLNEGFHPAEIFQLLSADKQWGFAGVSEKTVRRDIKVLQDEGARFALRNKRLQDRIGFLLFKRCNALLSIIHQAWLNFHAAKEDVHLKNESLTVIINANREFNRLMGLTGVNLRQMQDLEENELISRRQDEIEAAMKFRGGNVGPDLSKLK